MTKKDAIAANIYNLTTFWETASLPFNGYFAGPAFNYCEVKDSDWPNRLWFNGTISQDGLEDAFEIINSASSKLTLPRFDISSGKAEKLLEKKGFQLQFKQIGMSLKLDKPFIAQHRLKIKLVSNEEEAQLWAAIYPKAFGYRISAETVVKATRRIHFYLAYYDSYPVGTAILFHTNGIAGIHGVGVVPEMRRKGFAEEIMKIVLNHSIEEKAEYATLQASDMGKGIYLKLGFKEEFLISNYTLKQGSSPP